MNRTIKFRAWDSEEKRMLPDSSPMWKELVVTLDGRIGSITNEGEIVESELELMQFTGLLDKNGKEIYEGDIVYRVIESSYRRDYSETKTWDNWQGKAKQFCIIKIGEYDNKEEYESADSGYGVFFEQIGIVDFDYGDAPTKEGQEDKPSYWGKFTVEGNLQTLKKEWEVIGNVFSNPELLNNDSK